MIDKIAYFREIDKETSQDIDEYGGRFYDGIESFSHLFYGKTVEKVFSGNGDFGFLLDDDTFVRGDPEGDCCSSTWVEHVSGVSDIRGRKIVGISSRSEPPTQENVKSGECNDYEYLSLYGITFITDNGFRVDIDYRNSSNGYYGGWLNWSTSNGEPGIGWKEVTEDF